jgi:hypothetical protein
MPPRSRRVPALAAALLAAVALPVPAPRADDGFSCEGGIVSVGDARIDVLGKCGPATFVESRPEARSEWYGDRVQGYARTVTVLVETWTYDRGSDRLVQHVRLEAGRVTGVRSGGYGHAPAAPAPRPSVPRAGCEPSALRVGATTYDLLSLCGEPVFRDAREELLSVVEGEGPLVAGASATRVTETWTYDFGPRALVRLVQVRDGRVTAVRTGGYGYSQ